MAYNEIINPGEYLGILGGGQLGKMFCQAAVAMGYKTVVLCPEENPPARGACHHYIQAEYTDQEALACLGRMAKAVSTEFENVPASSLAFLEQFCPVRPNAQAVAIAQDRIQEKTFIAEQGLPVAPHVVIRTLSDVYNHPGVAACLPGILKAARLGYDGKGQVRVSTQEELYHAFNLLGVECVLEAFLPLKEEVSVLLARGPRGEVRHYPVAQNIHVNGILATTTVNPDDLPPTLCADARDIATTIAEKLDYVGVLCVEFFVLEDGSLVVNEMAPRPHNSGHYTQNGCFSSQFEQQARAMAGMPLGSSELLMPCMMLNILGDSWIAAQQAGHCEPAWADVLAIRGVSLHLYGKPDARKGRKMGHVNIVDRDMQRVRRHAIRVAKLLHLAHVPE